MNIQNEQDYIVRAIAGGGQVRCFSARTTAMAEEARGLHKTFPVATAALGRSLCAGAMMGCMLKSAEDCLTLSFHGDGPLGGIVVTAGADAYVKGYVINPRVAIDTKSNGKLDVSGALGSGYLSVIKDLGLKEPYNGRVDLVSGEIAEDLTYYFASSEQVPSSVGLGVLVAADEDRGELTAETDGEELPLHHHVVAAGGFIIQLMPHAGEDVIATIERNLSLFGSVTEHLSKGVSPEEMLHRLLSPLDIEITDRIPTGYRCDCSRDRVLGALAAIGKKDIEDMAAEKKDIEVGCHFCNKTYIFTPDELAELLKNR